MTTSAELILPKSALPCIQFDANNQPYIQGLRCRSCGAILADYRLACPACASREGFEPFRAAETGKLIAFSIVYRSYPGVPVPFISAIVETDDGLTLKGNLVGVEAKPEAVKPNLRVKIGFNDALGRKDKENASYIAYFFEPA
jgi:uncharacterized OB-fold protein